MTMITANNITKSFGTLQVLRGINLQVERGEVVAIVGPSGAGKTTLLQILGTLDSADSGTVTIDGTDVTQLRGDALARFRGQNIGFVFQLHQLLPEFTAEENVMMPALVAGVSSSEARRRAAELLAAVGLSDRATHKPAQLSGGEKQRVAVARALVNKPAVVLADEPSGSLDSAGRPALHQMLLDLRSKYNQTFVIVTHDEGMAQMADRVIRVVDGTIINAQCIPTEGSNAQLCLTENDKDE